LIQQLDGKSIGRANAQMRVEEFWMGALRQAVVEGDVDHGSLMAGQSVGLVNRIMSVEEIIQELVRDTGAELRRVHNALTR